MNTVDHETINNLLWLDNNRCIIKICSQKEVTDGLLLQWLHYNRIIYSFDDKARRDGADYYGKPNCCFCPKLAVHAFYNGYHPKFPNGYCNTEHPRWGFRYTCCMMCKDCVASSYRIVDESKNIAKIAIYRMSSILPMEICDLINTYFVDVTKYYRTLHRMLEC